MLSSSGKSARARPRPVSALSGDREAARHITRTWFEWEIDGLARNVILVVETDLAMQPDEQDYNALTFEMLHTEAFARSRASTGAIDRLSPGPVRYPTMAERR